MKIWFPTVSFLLNFFYVTCDFFVVHVSVFFFRLDGLSGTRRRDPRRDTVVNWDGGSVTLKSFLHASYALRTRLQFTPRSCGMYVRRTVSYCIIWTGVCEIASIEAKREISNKWPQNCTEMARLPVDMDRRACNLIHTRAILQSKTF